MLQLGALLTQEADARQALVALLTTENFPVAAITPQEVLNFEAQLAFSGWTADQLAFLRGVGNDDAFIEAMRPLIFTQDVNLVAGKIPAAFANQTLINTLRQGGRDLSPFAGVPGNPNCHGVRCLGFGDAVWRHQQRRSSTGVCQRRGSSGRYSCVLRTIACNTISRLPSRVPRFVSWT